MIIAKAIPLFVLVSACTGQSRADLYDCDGCEAIYDRSFAGLTSRAVIADSTEPGERMIIVGHVVKPDGKTPAPGVVLYLHHTNARGIYPRRGNGADATRDGYLRGWVMTDRNGDYTVETIRPAPYPSRNAPAHVHITLKEPGRKEYWIDELVFTDDPLVTDAYRGAQGNRGGNGVSTPTRDASGTWHVRRDITLER